MSDIYIYSGGTRVGVLQDYISVQWLINYQKPGEVKVDALATAQNMELLKLGNRLYNTEDDTAARIESVEISDDGSGGRLGVHAVSTAQLLDDRVMMASERVTNVEQAMYNIYTKNRRALPIAAAARKGFSETVDMELAWTSLLDAEQQLAEASGLGFKVVFDPLTASETFVVYKGADRTAGQGYNGYFGDDIGNLVNFNFNSSTQRLKNVAIVAGEDTEDADRVIETISLGNLSGEGRRELFVNASSIKKKYREAQPTGESDDRGNPKFEYTDGEYTAAQYAQKLQALGLEKLIEQAAENGLTTEVEENSLYYKKDFFLGDIIPIKLLGYNLLINARVSAIKLVYENGGRKLVIELADISIVNDKFAAAKYLYAHGSEFFEFTGGWKAYSGTLGKGAAFMQSSSSSATGSFGTARAVALGGIDAFSAVYKCWGTGNMSNSYAELCVFSSASGGAVVRSARIDPPLTQTKTEPEEKLTAVLNVSDLTGPYYVGVRVIAGQGVTTNLKLFELIKH